MCNTGAALILSAFIVLQKISTNFGAETGNSVALLTMAASPETLVRTRTAVASLLVLDESRILAARYRCSASPIIPVRMAG